MPKIEVTGLSYYPIKSCAATNPEVMSFSPRGPDYDREWMLVNERGKFMTQRNHPDMAQIMPAVDMLDGTLMVEAPDMEILEVCPEVAGEERPVEFWKKAGVGLTQGKEAADWFSTFFGKRVELLRVIGPRPIKQEAKVAKGVQSIGFADSFPILLTTEQSLYELNKHIDNPIPMNRFRPNIVVDGDLEPYDEDFWRQVRIGNLTGFIVRACDRCPVPETDQSTGFRPAAKGVVTAALEKTRHGIDTLNGSQGNFFGQNIIHIYEPDQTVRLGETLEVEVRSDDRNIIF